MIHLEENKSIEKFIENNNNENKLVYVNRYKMTVKGSKVTLKPASSPPPPQSPEIKKTGTSHIPNVNMLILKL